MNDKNQHNNTDNLLISILDNTPFGIISYDHLGHILLVNKQALVFLDLEFSIDELKEKNILEVITVPEELKKRVESGLSRKRKDFDLEGILFSNKYLTFRGRKISDGMIITMADITTIKRSEFLSLNSLLEGQEMERKRLAREIHDGIGPLLSALKLNLANIEGDIEKENNDLKKKFLKSNMLIDEVADDLRSISHNLLPKVLSDFGLIEALESLSEKIQTSNSVDMTFMHTGMEKRLDGVIELGIYRIGQELISNTLKHANARKITMQLIRRKDFLHLIFEDDGKGFDPETINKGIGIMNIQNRVKALGGEVNFDSHPGKGMTATIDIPYN